MPQFAYKARRRDGSGHSGLLEAADRSAAAAQLRADGLLVLDLAERAGSAPSRMKSPRRPIFTPRTIEVEHALRRMALLLNSGVSILESLEAVAENSASKRLTVILRDVGERIRAGDPLHESLARHGDVFPPLVVELVRAGEQSGTLEFALERSAAYVERKRTIRTSVLSAMMYPTIVIAMTSLVTALMVVKVIPELEKFLQGGHQRLPAITRALLSVTHAINDHGLQFLIGFVAVLLAIAACERFEPTRAVLDRITFALPFVSRVRVLSSTALFARSLGTLVESGVPLTLALSTSARILSRPVPRRAIERARQGVLRGDPLHKELIGAIPFAPILPRMIRIGEQSGALDRVLIDSARFHEAELEAWIKRASAIIEPLITIVVGSIVGVVYTAFFAAMFSIAGGG